MIMQKNVQKGIRAVLMANRGLTDLIGDRIYDEPKSTTAYPLVRMAAFDSEPYDTDRTEGQLITMSLEVQSRNESDPGRTQCSDIIDFIREALHRQPDAVNRGTDDATVYDCVYVSSDVSRAPEGKGWVGIIFFELMIDEGV